MTKKTIEFSFTKAEHLNSNSIPAHYHVKSKIAAAIREKSRLLGVAEHPDKNLSQARLDVIREEDTLKNKKSQSHKRLKKAGYSKEEIEEELAKIEKDFGLEIRSSEMEVPYIFDKFRLTVIVKTPTRRIVDPVNFYPTVKPLVDGLTDASWWNDDNFSHLLEVSFKYGGLSGEKGVYTLVMEFEEVDNHTDYITEAVIS